MSSIVSAAAGFPPPPHDPRERSVVGEVRGWEVRQFAPGDARLAYFAPRGFLHLQLWQPALRCSVLTPSRLTAGRFEAWQVGAARIGVAGWTQLADALVGIELPGAAAVAALERWLVMREESPHQRLLRTWWRGAAPRAHRG